MIVGGILTLCDLAQTIIAMYGMPLLVVQTRYVRTAVVTSNVVDREL